MAESRWNTVVHRLVQQSFGLTDSKLQGLVKVRKLENPTQKCFTLMLGQKRQVSDESDSISVFNFLLERL